MNKIKNLDFIQDGCFKEVIIDGERYSVENFNITVNRNLQQVWQIGRSYPTIIDPCGKPKPDLYPRLNDYCKCGNPRNEHYRGYGECSGTEWIVYGPNGEEGEINCQCEEFRYDQ